MQLSDEIILKCKNSNNPKGFTISRKTILTGLYKYGYTEEEIKRFIDSKCYSFDETDCLCQEELQHKIEEMNKVKDFSLYIEL